MTEKSAPLEATSAIKSWTAQYPTEYWQLFELVCAECPEAALAKFRKSIIGRGKPLKASQADAAIRAARFYTWGYDKPEDIERARLLHGLEDTDPDRIDRAWMYRNNGLPLILVRRAGQEFNDALAEFVFNQAPVGTEIVRLEFDDEAVDRVAG